jgi:putative ABC transport system permease protein
MSFFTLIIKNLLRQRVRTLLTVLGIGVGITTVVALGVITNALKATSGEILRTGGADFMVAQEGTSDLSFSTVTEADWAAIAARPDVRATRGMMFHITRAGSNPYFPLLGVRASDLAEPALPFLQGALFAPSAVDEIVLGDTAASDLKVQVGDTVTLDRRTFTVTGIYHTGSTIEDGGGYAPLAVVQQMTSKLGVVTAVWVSVADGFDIATVAQRIEEQFPNLAAVTSVAEYGEIDQGLQLVDAANLAISALAVGIGAIGVMNTMVMSVFERTRQIGILRAVGWSSSRILRMIIGEALILCVIAAIVGSLLGVLATRGLLLIPTIRSLLELRYTADIFVRALAVALTVALAGAAYPAFRAVRLSPMEALRYE